MRGEDALEHLGVAFALAIPLRAARASGDEFAAFGDRIASEGYFPLDGDGGLAGGFGIDLGGVADSDRFQRIAPAVGIEATGAGR